MLNFKSLAFSPLCRMNEVKRYSSVHLDTGENDAEHVAEVSMMSWIIANELISRGQKIDIGLLLQKCLFHDIDEVITGDIPRNTKYASKESHEALSKVAEDSIDLIEKSTGINFKYFWETSKSGPEGFILKIVDMLAVVKKVMTEVELRGNLSSLKVVIELERHLKNMMVSMNTGKHPGFKEEPFRLLINLVEEAKDEVTNIKLRYSHIIEKYNLQENVIQGE